MVARNFARLVRFEEATPVGATVEERLGSVGITILESALQDENIGLFRASIAEVRRFPDLAKEVSGMARERGNEAIARLLGEMAECGELHALRAFGPDRLRTTARFFLDLVVLPLIIRALFGESLESLRAEIRGHVSVRVPFFLAACRHGSDGLDERHESLQPTELARVAGDPDPRSALPSPLRQSRPRQSR